MSSNVVDEILALKKERNAVILAHNYVSGDVQDVADFCGDSLELSIKAAKTSSPVIVFCGVRFMAETAKILSPASKVLLPVPSAGCPMADMASASQIEEYRKTHPDAFFVAYVNSTAEVKACVDVCCTSGNVEKVLASIPKDKKIMFLPDCNLGGNMNLKTGRNMALWRGCCPVHDGVTKEMIEEARKIMPDGEVLIHPECKVEVVAAADKALSTGAMLKYVASSDKKEFIIATESGILHRLKKENPGKRFISLTPEILCRDMKKITLEDVRNSLRDVKTEVVLAEEIMTKARRPIERMLSLA